MDRDRGQGARDRDESDVPVVGHDRMLWHALTTDPTTGVTVMGYDGTVCYANDQAMRIFLGTDARIDEVVGRKLDEVFPEDFSAERMRVLRGVIDRNRPVLFRAIWRGYQHLSWVTPIAGPAGGEGQRQGLVITRRVAGDTDEIVLAQKGFRQVNANVIDLGELGSLSPRELVVLALLGGGLSLKEIARYLRRSLSTIETQRESIGRKLKLADRAELIRLVERTGLRLEDLRDHHDGPA